MPMWSRKRKLLYVGILAAMLCVSALASFYWYWRTLGFFPRDAAAAKIRSIQDLVNSNVNRGDSPEAVYRFLDAQNLGYSRLAKDAASLSGYDYRNDNTVIAIKRDIAGSSLVTESLLIIFVFDDQRKLTRIDFVPQLTGL